MLESLTLLPAQAIESYNQENPGLLEDLGIVVEPVEGTSEVKLTAEQYETLEDVAPELAEAVKNDVRRGSKGITTREVGETKAFFISKKFFLLVFLQGFFHECFL